MSIIKRTPAWFYGICDLFECQLGIIGGQFPESPEYYQRSCGPNPHKGWRTEGMLRVRIQRISIDVRFLR